jgi:hypothetical protein
MGFIHIKFRRELNMFRKGFTRFFIFNLILASCSSSKFHENALAIAHSIHDVITMTFVQQKLEITLLIIGNMTTKFDLIVDKLGYLNDMKYKYKINKLLCRDEDFQKKFNDSKAAVIFYESEDIFDFCFSINFFRHIEKSIVFVDGDKSIQKHADHVENSLSMYQSFNLLLRSYFLVQVNDNAIKLLTIELITGKSCNTTQINEINKFSIQFLSWKYEPLKIEKRFENFHQCPFYMTTNHFLNYDLVATTMQAIAKMFNATIEYSPEVNLQVAIKNFGSSLGTYNGNFI